MPGLRGATVARHRERQTKMTSAQSEAQFSGVLERMIAMLETENEALRERRPYSIGEVNARKTMALYELERLGGMRATTSAKPFERLGQARKLLNENRALLERDISALVEIIELMNSHELSESSDGTYSARSISQLVGA